MDPRELAALRSLPLTSVLERLGAERDPKDPKRNWRFGASRLTVTDARFYDHNQAGAVHRMRTGKAGGGGAIDLVQYLKNVSLPEAARELANWAGSHTRLIELERARPKDESRDKRPVPQPASDPTTRARWYLTQVRALPEPIVEAALSAGKVFTDAKGNVVFRLTDEAGRNVGYEVRGTYERPYHSVHGTKGLFIAKAGGEQVAAFVESGIEALSYQALKGQGLVISTTGNAAQIPARLASALEARGYAITAAFNADAAGDRMALALQSRLKSTIRRDRPASAGQDWNDELKRSRDQTRKPAGRHELADTSDLKWTR